MKTLHLAKRLSLVPLSPSLSCVKLSGELHQSADSEMPLSRAGGGRGNAPERLCDLLRGEAEAKSPTLIRKSCAGSWVQQRALNLAAVSLEQRRQRPGWTGGTNQLQDQHLPPRSPAFSTNIKESVTCALKWRYLWKLDDVFCGNELQVYSVCFWACADVWRGLGWLHEHSVPSCTQTSHDM